MGDNGGGGDNDMGGGPSHLWGKTPTNNLYLPTFGFGGPSLPHYYGDYVRRIFIGISIATVISAPIFIGTFPVVLPFAVIAACALVCLAALTNPKKHWTMVANTLASAIGLIVAEIIALFAYASGETLIFVALEALALAFMFALYFSLKTVRAMVLGHIGKRHTAAEFFEEEH